MAQGTCRICGRHDADGLEFDDWVRPTFTNWDDLVPGNVICNDCLFWFDENSEALANRIGKDSSRYVRMRNYSHFIANGEWTPLSKADKDGMQEILLSSPFPEMAAIADSGQKHIAFRAKRNPPGSSCGWVQFEEDAVFVDPDELRIILESVERLYTAFSKTEIGTGSYKQYRIFDFGIERWQELESDIAHLRGSLIFNLALFLAQKKEEYERDTSTGSGLADDNLAGGSVGLQEQIPQDDMEAVRGPGEERGIHEQSGKICQLALF